MFFICFISHVILNFCLFFFFFNDTATTEIYTLSYTTLFRSCRTWRCCLRRHSCGSPRRRSSPCQALRLYSRSCLVVSQSARTRKCARTQRASPFCKGRSRLCQRQVSGSSEGGVSLPRALRRYSDGGTPTWLRKKRVKLLCAEKPSSADTSEILPWPEDRREMAVSTHSMSR